MHNGEESSCLNPGRLYLHDAREDMQRYLQLRQRPPNAKQSAHPTQDQNDESAET